ncbi:hypothetical protein ACFW9V_22645 [Streptomyces hygroscopicus]|uniref:hypothetical protein n=1 Tax=Streptomyces hygroscopicus TaxID=1912 RepID=UPI0036AA3646
MKRFERGDFPVRSTLHRLLGDAEHGMSPKVHVEDQRIVMLFFVAAVTVSVFAATAFFSITQQGSSSDHLTSILGGPGRAAVALNKDARDTGWG